MVAHPASIQQSGLRIHKKGTGSIRGECGATLHVCQQLSGVSLLLLVLLMLLVVLLMLLVVVMLFGAGSASGAWSACSCWCWSCCWYW
jgi:hypothetical protein